MFKKLKAFYELFKVGKAVADPALWKNRGIKAGAITAVLWGCIHAAESFGITVPIDGATVDAVAVGALALINWVFTLITSEKVGV